MEKVVTSVNQKKGRKTGSYAAREESIAILKPLQSTPILPPPRFPPPATLYATGLRRFSALASTKKLDLRFSPKSSRVRLSVE